MSELLTAIDEADTPYRSPSWSPTQVGDLIAGTCEMINFEHVTKFGESLMIKIDAEKVISDGEEYPGGDIWTIWEKTHIRQIALDKKLRIGDQVAFKYVGEDEKSKGKSKKKLFAAVVERTSESGDFIGPQKPYVHETLEKKAEPKESETFEDDIPY